jgi:large subunit ribosomal protein L35
MPKMKTHSGMSKRIKVTGKGKLMMEPAAKRHKLLTKTSSDKRRLSGNVEISKADTPRVKKMLGR